MNRAVVLTTLVLLLLAVAGVSAAQERGIFTGGPNIDAPPGSTTDVGRPGNGEPEENGNEVEQGRGGGQQKVTLCHKGKKILTVGEPALAAHERHGDREGACQTEGAGSEASGETMGSEAAKNGGGGASGGQTKVTLCHKGKKTLTVGAPAQAAHLRHGDNLGVCR
jgi:hypothetical protein